MEDRCRLCGLRRGSESEYCRYHQTAMKNLEIAFENWEKALGIGWLGFLKEVMERKETGAWTKDVAADLLSKERL